MELIGCDKQELVAYIARQLDNLFPDGKGDVLATLNHHIDQALARLNTCINAVRMWPRDKFDYLHSEQYTIFIYYLANTIWRNCQNQNVCCKLFFLNKALNGFNCFYDVELPDIFFIGHSVGIVLARTTYSNYFVLYQNSTVGKNHGDAPVLGEGVVMYPNTAIIGRCQIPNNTVICQGTSVINQNPPGDCMVFAGDGKDLIYKPMQRDILSDIFRI